MGVTLNVVTYRGRPGAVYRGGGPGLCIGGKPRAVYRGGGPGLCIGGEARGCV